MNNEKLFNYFYKFVDKIIYDIHCNKTINNHLFNCNYFILNTQLLDYYPLTICLGGGGYIQYKNIFDRRTARPFVWQKLPRRRRPSSRRRPPPPSLSLHFL